MRVMCMASCVNKVKILECEMKIGDIIVTSACCSHDRITWIQGVHLRNREKVEHWKRGVASPFFGQDWADWQCLHILCNYLLHDR